MKKLITIILILALFMPAAALADVDLTGMTYEELVKLKDQINLAIWNSQEWQEVTVPVGLWTIGEDIPAGHWSICLKEDSPQNFVAFTYTDLLDESGKDAGNRFDAKIYYYGQLGKPGYKDGKYADSIDIELKEGTYLIVEYGPVIFTPYAGKPDLGFK